MNTLEDAFFFPSHIFQPCEMSMWQPQSLLCQWTSKWGWKKDDSSEEEEREKCLHHLCWRAMPCLHKKQAVRWRSIWFHCSSSGCICELYWSCTTERGEEGQIEKILSHYLSFVRHIYTQHKFGLLSNISKNTKLSNLFLLKPGNSNKHQSYYSRNPRPWGFPPNIVNNRSEKMLKGGKTTHISVGTKPRQIPVVIIQGLQPVESKQVLSWGGDFKKMSCLTNTKITLKKTWKRDIDY